MSWMWVPGSLVILTAVLLGMKLLLARGEARKRSLEAQSGDFDALTPSPVRSLTDQWQSLRPTQALLTEAQALAEELGGRQPRVSDGAQIVFFVGHAAAVKYHGMLNAPPALMPVRVGVRLRPTAGGSQVEIKVDEDFGFQLFMGFAKAAFHEKYEAQVSQVGAALRERLA